MNYDKLSGHLHRLRVLVEAANNVVQIPRTALGEDHSNYADLVKQFLSRIHGELEAAELVAGTYGPPDDGTSIQAQVNAAYSEIDSDGFIKIYERSTLTTAEVHKGLGPVVKDAERLAEAVCPSSVEAVNAMNAVVAQALRQRAERDAAATDIYDAATRAASAP